MSISRTTIATFFYAASVLQAHAQEAALPSWNDGETKSAILDFVASVTTETSPDFVPASDRIATFDNDGTLWTEKPLYVHFYGIVEQMKRQIAADPALAEREPYKTAVTKDPAYFTQLYESASYASLVGQLFGVPFGGMTDAQYADWADAFLADFKHPEFGVGVEDLVYQPMVELIDYLEANEFTVYIFTADEGAFLRQISEELYGLPPAQVQGTKIRHEYIITDGMPTFTRTYALEHFNNWDGKPRQIQSAIGKHPIFAAGNSNGDQHMLQYAALGGGMSLLVHHTDADRETAYELHMDKVLPLAEEEGWTVVDMKDDWKTVFPK
ncbi:HAD family hydrolase [Roseovarius sp. C7]|uniref:HAD family hydrolase n=1 Tax=Roseovarius sp. C7 TaxID=3398643 RepID=UPI0039F4DBF7